MVKVRRQNTNRNTVKQPAENGLKFWAGDEEAASLTSLVPGVKQSRLQHGFELDQAY